jgi:Xaa-Pro aminopeptidase
MTIYEMRIKELQRELGREKLDGLVLFRALEVGYFTGFHTEGAALLVSRRGAWAFMPRMLLEQFKAAVGFVKASAPEKILEAMAARRRELGLKKAAFEAPNETYLRGTFLRSAGFTEHPGLTARLREVKDAAEQQAIRKACAIAGKAFGLVKPRIKTGRTEASVSRELEDIMQSMGATGNSFSLIVGFGPNSALPHHASSDRPLRRDEVVLLDYGCVYGHYCSDITRTYFHGRPDAEFRKVWGIVAASQKAGLARVRAVDAACRDHIADAGYGQYFIHGTGHGIGLQIHEAPGVNTRTAETLKAGMAITVEPGIYLPGKFGVRIEDSVLVKKGGYELLTRAAYN